jgi:hypothetical protein
LILRDRADQINSWAFSETKTKSDQYIYDLLEVSLYMFGRGYFCVNSDASIGCCAPQGPAPTAEEVRKIDLLVERVRPLVRRALFNVLKADRRY